jgi:AcrR family transcriptional regulator
MRTDTRIPVRRRRKHARPEELRDAALALFVEQGFDATLTEDIAALAGVSKGTLYLYYPSKETLLRAAISSPLLQTLARLRPVFKRDGNSTEVLRRVMFDIWAQLQEQTVGGVLKLALTEAQRFPEIMEVWQHQMVKPLRVVIAEVLLQGMERGEFRQVAVDAVAHSLLLPMFMVCLQRRLMGKAATLDRCLDDGFMAQHIDLVLQGLVCDTEAGSRGRTTQGR